MRRILVADDDASIRMVVQETLEEEYEVRVAEKPSVAIEFARREQFDMVISDVNMPEMSGFWMCKEIRKLPGKAEIPFLFMSGADERAELDIAHSLGSERLLLKPFAIDALVRAVRAKLGEARTEKGDVTSVLASILSRAANKRESGLLTTVDGATCKRFVLRDGALVFASSNDRQDLIGQALIRAGVISERDLLEAFAASASASPEAPRLAAALTSMRKLTPEQCQKAFVGKVRESLLDVFLWETGTAELMTGPVVGAEGPFPLAIELRALAAEGSRRRARWAAMRGVLPPPDHQIERAMSWPSGFPKNGGEQVLAKHIDRGVSLGEIFVELRGNRFAVGVRIAQLIEAGVVRVVTPVGFTGAALQEPSPEELERARLELELEARMREQTDPRIVSSPLLGESIATATASVQPPVTDSQAFTVALLRFRAGDLEGAREGFVEVLASDPLNELARLRLDEIGEAMAIRLQQRGMRHERRIRLAVPVATLLGQTLAASETFVLSRLVRGPCSIGDLVVVSPLPEGEILRSVERLLTIGALADEMQPIPLRAEYRTAAAAVNELTRAISKSELHVETKAPLPVGTKFALEIISPDLAQPLAITGVVTFVVEHGVGSYGMTLKYLFDSEQARAQVEAAVETILRGADSDTRRHWTRIPTAYRVAESGDPLHSTYTLRNLSRGGMLLVPDSADLGGDTILVGTRVTLSFVASGGTFELLGTVVWTAGRSKAGSGGALGVEFDPGAEVLRDDLVTMKLLPQSLFIVFG